MYLTFWTIIQPSRPGMLLNASYGSSSNLNLLSYGDTLEFVCNSGYMLASGGTDYSTHTKRFKSTCGGNGEMSALDEYCTPTPCTLALDQNAQTIAPAGSTITSVYGDNVTVTCKSGFRASSNSRASCSDSVAYSGTCKEWALLTTPPGTSCKRVACDGLDSIRSQLFGGLMSSTVVPDNVDSMNFGDEINVTCSTDDYSGSSTWQKKTLRC